MGWSDVGSWDALLAISPCDERGNHHRGEVLAIDTKNCLIRTDRVRVAAVDVQDLIVVASGDDILIGGQGRDRMEGGEGRDTYVIGAGDTLLAMCRLARAADIAVIEGVMGLYDGHIGREGFASTAHVAELTASPVILVVDISHASRSIAAVVLGHVNATGGGPGVFADLPVLTPGDEIRVHRADGTQAQFRVTHAERYAKDAFEGLALMDAVMAVKRGVPGASLPEPRKRRTQRGNQPSE